MRFGAHAEKKKARFREKKKGGVEGKEMNRKGVERFKHGKTG